jgi:hypothetical protein
MDRSRIGSVADVHIEALSGSSDVRSRIPDSRREDCIQIGPGQRRGLENDFLVGSVTRDHRRGGELDEIEPVNEAT